MLPQTMLLLLLAVARGRIVLWNNVAFGHADSTAPLRIHACGSSTQGLNSGDCALAHTTTAMSPPSQADEDSNSCARPDRRPRPQHQRRALLVTTTLL